MLYLIQLDLLSRKYGECSVEYMALEEAAEHMLGWAYED